MLFIKLIRNLNIMEILKKIKKMDLVLKNIKMVPFLKEILLIIKKVDMVFILSLMMKNMKEISKMIYLMEKDNIYGEKVVKNI